MASTAGPPVGRPASAATTRKPQRQTTAAPQADAIAPYAPRPRYPSRAPAALGLITGQAPVSGSSAAPGARIVAYSGFRPYVSESWQHVRSSSHVAPGSATAGCTSSQNASPPTLRPCVAAPGLISGCRLGSGQLGADMDQRGVGVVRLGDGSRVGASRPRSGRRARPQLRGGRELEDGNEEDGAARSAFAEPRHGARSPQTGACQEAGKAQETG